MKKAILNDKEICRLYVEDKLGVETIAKKLHTSKQRIKGILKKNEIALKPRGGQVTHKPYLIEDFHIKKYVNGDNFHYVAVDKNTGVESKDIDNYSGFLTTYIENEYGIKTPPLYERQQYYMTTGNYWWEQWLTVEKRQNKEVKKCPYCDWTTYDINNLGGCFRVHLKKAHNLEIVDYLKEHPEDKDYMTFGNKSLNIQFETDEKKFVTCGVCGKKFARISKQHINTHGLTVEQYKEKYGRTFCDDYEEFLRNNMIQTNTNMKPKFTSKPQKEIKEFIESYGFECILNNRKSLKGKEIDIYIPSIKLGIEYNGNFWHQEGMNRKTNRTHLEKTISAKENGVKLLQIFEDEYVLHKEIVLQKIAHLLKSENNFPRVPARKCFIKEINKNFAEVFLDNNHIQGFASSTVYLGAFFNDNLVGVMTFSKEENTNNDWILARFATDIHSICQGVGGKLFKFFLKKYNPSKIKSFADRRWTVEEENNFYTKLGFTFDGYTPPSYTYYNPKIDKVRRFHKFGFRKQILHRKYGLPLTMTEKEMTESLGYRRIWDCGLIRYVYRNPNVVKTLEAPEVNVKNCK